MASAKEIEVQETSLDEVVNAVVDDAARVDVERYFTIPGRDPFDEIEWEIRDAFIPGKDKAVFEQKGVEFPKFWSQTATNIVAQKYFRGRLGSPERESSVREMIGRVVSTIGGWGRAGGYFADAEEAETFEAELKAILVNQLAAFNSPVWFNVGFEEKPQCSACFILSIEDSMESILDWIRREGIIFRGGSGSGVNLSRLRSSKEQLSKGGHASGPVSFMRGADASAGTIKSGGKTRRAAKMVVLDVDHPDIEEFIWCKAHEEEKARVLEAAGYDMSLNSPDWASIQYQNANNSVRVTDAFMEASVAGREWNLTARTDGTVVRTVDASGLLKQIAEAAWRCADPGVQYDTTINSWHTCPNSGRINASNPCFPGDARVHTAIGLIPFAELYARAEAGEEFHVYTHRATADRPGEGVAATKPLVVMQNGVSPIVRLRFANGQELRCTPNHRIWTLNRGYVQAAELTAEDEVLLNDSPTPAEDASWSLPIRMEAYAKSFSRGGTVTYGELPDRWSEGLSELMGHLVGDGWITDVQTGWVYGGDDIEDGLADSHEGLLQELIGSISRQEMSNGTVQLRAGSETVRTFFRWLGVSTGRAYEKRVPESVFAAPTEVQAAFLRGLFGADGCVSRVEAGKASRYVGLGSRSEGLLKDVQRLLNAFGIRSRIYRVTGTGKGASFAYQRVDGSHITYDAREGFDLRITGSDLERFAEGIGFSAPRKNKALAVLLEETTRYRSKSETTLVSREDDGQEYVYNLTEPLHHSYIVDGILVANCSEYMHLDDSACNLASLNLMKFRRDDGELDVEALQHAVDTVFLAQEIIVGYSSYPTPEIERNAKSFRQLGLGYANLGALLMARGLPYDSDEGRAYAAAITALMTGRAYRKSAEIAFRMGAFAGYRPNTAAMLGVIAKHRAAVGNIQHADSVPADLLSAARQAWDDALNLGEVSGFRNAQSVVIAPTGTISFMMDCDTTGVEPDFSLVKSKKLVGGGEITIVNKTVPMALEKLGYAPSEIEEVVAYIDDRNTIVGAPYVKQEHYPVFDCAIGDRAIHYMGHVKMMGAVQPFISGAISKCVVGETLVPTADGLVRIGRLYRGEVEDSFRDMRLPLASLDGLRETDAFYYGGACQTLEVILRSGHRLAGTPNHRVLVATPESGLDWRRLDELQPDDQVAIQYGDDLWSSKPARFGDFAATKAYGSQKAVTIPEAMTEDLAFFLGAYAAEGHTARSNYTVRIANADEEVIARLVELGTTLFGSRARVARSPGKCPSIELSSKTLVEFLDYLGCGDRARNKRIPDAVLRSPREMVLAFLEGLSLDSYIPSAVPKWAICVASNGLLDDLQAVLTNLGIVHSRISKFNAEYERSFDEVNVFGRHAQKLTAMLRFPEAHKSARALQLQEMVLAQSTADVVPGISGRGLYELIPAGRSGRSGRGTGRSRRFRHLVDPRTAHVSWTSLERVATVPGVEFPDWLQTVFERNLHFSPVTEIADGGKREVYDVSVPITHAFVGNGIVSHNTVNLPEQATVDEVAQLLADAWRLGVKAIAIYRDNCKVAQPLSKKGEQTALAPPGVAVVPQPRRRRLPDDRTEIGRKFRVGEYEGYIHVGLFENGTPGDIFVDIAKEGTTLAGLMNSFMISVSLGLQYGVPLEVYVSKFAHMRFEPSGMTNDPDIRAAKSIVDYIFRWMGKKFLSLDQQEEAGILSPEVRARLAERYNGGGDDPPPAAAAETPPPGQTALFNQWEDAVECARCGGRMVRTGSCYTCRDCGTNTGCS